MDKEKLIEWIYTNEEMVDVPDDKYFAVKSCHLVYAINKGAFEKEPCEFCSNDLNQGFHQDFETLSCRLFVSGDFEKVIVKCNFCPSCGRALSTNK